MSNFTVFYYTSRSMNDCFEALDVPARYQSGTPYRSDSAENEIVCRQCQCCLWPILVPLDLITLPFRGIKHLIKKQKKSN